MPWIPPRTNYRQIHRDFNEIKNNLNTCIEAVNRFIEDFFNAIKCSHWGQTWYKGRWYTTWMRWKIVEGVNDTLDAVTGSLNVAVEYVKLTWVEKFLNLLQIAITVIFRGKLCKVNGISLYQECIQNFFAHGPVMEKGCNETLQNTPEVIKNSEIVWHALHAWVE